MPKMVEVVIDSVRVSLTNQQRIVVLRQVDAERYLPIWIGPFEAEAITIALQEIEVARPQTHDLLRNVLHALNARLLRVEVVELKEDIFYGNLVIEINGQIINIDSRPSDALAIGVRTGVPILVDKNVMDAAGIVPDEDIQEQEKPAQEPTVPHQPEEIEQRLSVFEDFLDKLNIDDIDDTPSEKDDPPQPPVDDDKK